MCKKLIIVSEVEDFCGRWTKAEVEQEMRELDYQPKTENDWLYWICDHVFDFSSSFNSEMEKAVCEIDDLREVTFRLDEGDVTIKKIC